MKEILQICLEKQKVIINLNNLNNLSNQNKQLKFLLLNNQAQIQTLLKQMESNPKRRNKELLPLTICLVLNDDYIKFSKIINL